MEAQLPVLCSPSWTSRGSGHGSCGWAAAGSGRVPVVVTCAAGNLHKRPAPRSRQGSKLLPDAAVCPGKSYLQLRLPKYLSCLMKACLAPVWSSCSRCGPGSGHCVFTCFQPVLGPRAEQPGLLEGNKSHLEGWHGLPPICLLAEQSSACWPLLCASRCRPIPRPSQLLAHLL